MDWARFGLLVCGCILGYWLVDLAHFGLPVGRFGSFWITGWWIGFIFGYWLVKWIHFGLPAGGLGSFWFTGLWIGFNLGYQLGFCWLIGLIFVNGWRIGHNLAYQLVDWAHFGLLVSGLGTFWVTG